MMTPTLRLVLLLTLMCAPHPARAEHAADPARGLFGSVETEHQSLVAFNKWRGVLARARVGMVGPGTGTAAGTSAIDAGGDGDLAEQPLIEPVDLPDGIADLPVWQQLVSVNGAMNALPYVPDERNWGVSDYWATPREFMAKGGDCEDYAIAKYAMLRQLGVARSAMRLVIVHDTVLNIPHAILEVAVGGKRYILDNQNDEILTDKEISRYRPVYSINEFAWWMHQPG